MNRPGIELTPEVSYSPEIRERAVRLVFVQQKEHTSQWSAIKSIASRISLTIAGYWSRLEIFHQQNLKWHIIAN